jgi:hypothetical protein
LFGVQYIVSTGASTTCDLHDDVILNITKSKMVKDVLAMVEEQGVTVDVMEILKCSGQNTLANITKADKLVNILR